MRAGRRFNKPRKIGGESSDENDGSSPVVVVKKKPTPQATTTASDSQNTPSVVTRPKVKRPTSTSLGLSEPTSRLSFNDEDSSTNNSEGDKPFQLKKSALSRKVLERAAANRAGGRLLPVPLPRDEARDDDEKPNLYSKEYLAELRSSTPTTPMEVLTNDGEDVIMTDEDPLGTFSKFGTTAVAASAAAIASSKSTSIPDPALVKVLKARRAADATKATQKASSSSAKEFISLTPSDDDSDNASHKKKPSRLVRTEILDEDDDPELSSFVNDLSASTSASHPSRLLLTSALSSRKGAESAERHLRQTQIQQALELSDSAASSDTDPSPDEDSDSAIPDDTWHRRQLRIATGGKSISQNDPTSSIEARLSYQPPNIPPVPDLSSKLKWLEDVLSEMVKIRDGTVAKVDEVRKEREDIIKREKEVQEGLKRVGEEYAKLGLGNPEEAEGASEAATPGGTVGMAGRGLESLGTPMQVG